MHTVLRPEGAVERIGQLAREHQLPVIGTSFGGAMWDRQQHTAVLDDAELIVPRLAKLGGRTLGVSVGPVKWGSGIRKTPDQLDAQAELLTKIFAICKRHSVVPNLHNHTYEVENDLHDLKGALARLPGTKLGPDLNWLVRGGVDPVAFLRQYGSQIVFLHLRDQYQDGRWSEALGEGDMDYLGHRGGASRYPLPRRRHHRIGPRTRFQAHPSPARELEDQPPVRKRDDGFLRRKANSVRKMKLQPFPSTLLCLRLAATASSQTAGLP